MAEEGILYVKNVSKSFNGKKVVDDVSLYVKEGEIVGLLGPNGAGKTTTFYIIVGLIKPDSGSVYMENREITKLTMPERARLGIGYLPQEASIFRNLTVWENIKLVLEEINLLSEKEHHLVIERILSEFNISHLAESYGNSLSGGERRRVEIARLVATMPKFLLLDEPFSGIDPITVYDIQQLILMLKNKGYGILLTDHNVRETLAITDRAYLIHKGRVVVEGTPDEIVNTKEAKNYYLGEKFSW